MFENYFKNRKEVVNYFGREMFQFTLMSDNIMHYETLNPQFIDGELFSFELSFFYENGQDFLRYSNFRSYLDKFQLCEVIAISEETHKRYTMFFSRYKDK